MDARYNNLSGKNISPGPARQASSSSMKRQTSGSWSSSGGDGKLEKKRSIVKRESEEPSTNGLQIFTQHDPRDNTINELRGDLEKLRRSCTCVICQELLFEPFFFQCGHVYCYGCIVQWIGQAKSKKARFCPQCREVIKSKPSPAYLVRDMIEIFIQRAEIMSPTGSGSDLRKQQKEMVQAIKKDTSPKGLGLFKGLFENKPLLGIRDQYDEGILRCPECTWEVHGGRCENPECGARVREARDGDFTDYSESGSATEGESEIDDRGIAAPDRWPESVMGEETGEDIDEFDGYDEDGWEDEIEHPGVRLPNPVVINEEDEEPVTNRPRQNARPHFTTETDDDEDDSDNDTEGSLADFVVNDTSSPEISRRDRQGRVEPPRRNRLGRAGPPWALSSSPVAEPLEPPRRGGGAQRRARPIILDDDDDQSSLSEASSAPGFSAAPRRGFRSARDHRNHITISSDYDDDEDQSLLSNGYQALAGHQTASENEDDGILTPPPRFQHRRNFINTPGSVFSVAEEDEDEYGDADDSEDADGDVRMSENDQRGIGSSRQANRSRVQPIELDSASESEAALSARRRQRRAPVQSTTSRTNYFATHQRNASGGSRNNNQRNRLSALIDPQLQNLFFSHSQMLADQQYNSLGGRTSSVSPARSLTPVQRDITGARRAAGSRTGSRASSRTESRNIGSRDTTPVQDSADNTPPPFSPLQPSESQPRSRYGTIEPTPSPGQITPGSSQATSYHSVPSPSPRLASLSPRSGGSALPSHVQPQIQRTASPGFGIRVRSRASRSSLRGTPSRTGLRNNSAQGSNMSSFAGGTGIAGLQGRRTPQQTHQQHQPPRQQQPQEQTHSTSGMPPRPRYLTSDDVRARGQLAIQQRRSQSMEPSPGTVSNNNGSGNRDPADPTGRTPRIAALIGGGPANSRGGGPMLVFGSETQ